MSGILFLIFASCEPLNDPERPKIKTRAPVLHKARISADNFGVVDSNRL